MALYCENICCQLPACIFAVSPPRGAVDAREVIDLFAAAGLDSARLDILSEEFLQRVSAPDQKNLAMETLRKLLNDQVRVTERKNLVLSNQFREALEEAMIRYTNKQITTARVTERPKLGHL
jgi:type I restriction enzyme R subunit